MADSQRSVTARVGPWLCLVILLMIPFAYWAYADWNDERIRQALIGKWSNGKLTVIFQADGTGIDAFNSRFRWWVRNKTEYSSANIDPVTSTPDTMHATRIISVDDAQLITRHLVRRDVYYDIT